MAGTDEAVVVSPRVLRVVVERTWRAVGGDERAATLLADQLVGANLAGHDSHGVGLLPAYVRGVRRGTLVVGGHLEIARDVGAVVSADGGHRLGQVMGVEAMEVGIERARQHGVGVVALRRSHHLGRIGHWAEQCADAGFASVHVVDVAGGLFVAPRHGRDARFGTNPFCMGYPLPGRPPLILDFATSRLALGKTQVAYNAGRPVPAGCVQDAQGRPTTDPGVMWNEPMGSLLPFGGYKGYGLAVMCEVFAGALGGGETTREEFRPGDSMVNDMLSIVLDPAAFDAPEGPRRAEAFLAWVGASPTDDDRIMLPGDPESAARERRSVEGVPVDPTTWRGVRQAALDAGVAPEDVPTA